MLNPDNIPNTKAIHISEIKEGSVLVNLGGLLEIEEHEECYVLVISRMNEKQVFKFEKGTVLITILS